MAPRHPVPQLIKAELVALGGNATARSRRLGSAVGSDHSNKNSCLLLSGGLEFAFCPPPPSPPPPLVSVSSLKQSKKLLGGGETLFPCCEGFSSKKN